jgi:hypothetical protein
MSDGDAPPRQQSIDYIARLLRMNPIHQGAEIIHARNELLRVVTGESVAAEAIVSRQQAHDYRREALEKLNSVRAGFWTLPLADLNAQLEAVENLAFDDLKRVARRLQVVARHREAFLSVMGLAPVETEFADALKEVLVRSPRDTVILREHVLDTFDIRARRNACKQKLRILKARLPTLYELEAEWFNSMCRGKAGASRFHWTSRSGRARAAPRSNSKLRYVSLFIVAGSFLVRLITAGVETNQTSKPYVSDRYNRSYESEQLLQRPQRVTQNLPHEQPFSDKGIWQPYEMPGTSSREERLGIPSREPHQQMTRPGNPSPGIPAIELDDRYSR